MINEVKIDNINTILTPKKDQPNRVQNPVASTSNEGITISTGISKHIQFLMSEDSAINDQARVTEMKNRIDSDNYSINMDQLADKIAQNVFGKKIG